MVVLKGIKKYYGDFVALKGIDLCLGGEGVVGLLGVNGAGKTTLMRVLSGYFTADEGECLIDGIDIHTHCTEAQKKIGYLPETPPLYGELKVIEYLNFCAELKGITRRERKSEVGFAVEKLRLKDRLHQVIGSLSKGYKQRVGIAMSILGNPKLIILDEPMVGLDPLQQEETRELIVELGKKRVVLLSSHILSEVESVCSQIVMLQSGRIVSFGTKESLLRGLDIREEIRLEIEGEKEKVESLMKGLKASKQWGIEGFSSEDDNQFLIFGKGILAQRSRILKSLIMGGVDVVAFEQKKEQLEELFTRDKNDK